MWGKKIEIRVKKSNVVRDIYPADHITSSTIAQTTGRFLAYLSSAHRLMTEFRQGPPAWIIAHQNCHMTESCENIPRKSALKHFLKKCLEEGKEGKLPVWCELGSPHGSERIELSAESLRSVVKWTFTTGLLSPKARGVLVSSPPRLWSEDVVPGLPLTWLWLKSWERAASILSVVFWMRGLSVKWSNSDSPSQSFRSLYEFEFRE